jgi:hypothetical protein
MAASAHRWPTERADGLTPYRLYQHLPGALAINWPTADCH